MRNLFFAVLALMVIGTISSCQGETPSGSKEVPAEVAAKNEERVKCQATLEASKAAHSVLAAKREYWEATVKVRYCAGVLDDQGLKALLAESEQKAYLQDIRDPKTPFRTKARLIEAFIRDYPEEGKKYQSQIASLDARGQKQERASEAKQRKGEGVTVGMTTEEAIASSWGKPSKVNRTTYSWGTREQWVYGGGYLYFTDGVLTAIQN